MGILKFKKANCKNCYKCIRNCPVKAIEVKNHQAQIIERDCILCGNCMVVCPQNAKEVRNDVLTIKNLIREGKQVIASIAPSFISNYNVTQFSQFASILRKLGFSDAFETAEGAYIVKSEYEKLIKSNWKNIIISSCCPTVVKLVQKHYPEALKYLAPVISPVQAHSKLLKSEIKDAIVVFVGPCISKKEECVRGEEYNDIAITFEELDTWIKEDGLKFEDNKNIDNNTYVSRLFPISGGILNTMNKRNDYRYVAVDGLDNCIETLKEIINNNLDNCFIEMSACSGSCINGPASSHNKSLRISSMNKVESIALNKNNPTDFNFKYSIDTSRRFKDEQIVIQSPSDKEISSVLKKMGKISIEDELNCGTCGYSTCREKAIAVILGKAEISMCLPYMKEKAESFSDKIISVTPNAILTVDTNLVVQQINKSACEIFEVESSRDIIGLPISRVMDDFDFINVISNEENIINENVYLPEYDKFVKQNFIYDKNSGIIICIMKDITKLKRKREKLIKEKTNRADITDKIVEKHMCIVHEIASLLGETAAETQIALTDLKEAILMEEEDYD
ncbi:[Fe-Fe] hydrogenase large subunit C-terminal domain-containing protein [uncultured Clostridium sp.]|uniref:[Fe-Fe] hydrogenase large subunit C-terminal domain-containing protein n=1 Tax=uncultured Clostridium sp. TaxID=59620 RepID=UPI003217290E